MCALRCCSPTNASRSWRVDCSDSRPLRRWRERHGRYRASMADPESTINELWDSRDELQAGDPDEGKSILEAMTLLDQGEARVAEVAPATDQVVVHDWLKRDILLQFR